MKKKLILFVLAACTFMACNTRGDSDPDGDDKDTINSSHNADKQIQQKLNADTSANSPGESDEASTKRDSSK